MDVFTTWTAGARPGIVQELENVKNLFTISKLQEIINRCKTPGKILWFMQYISDGIRQKTLDLDSVNAATIRTHTRNSISDCAMLQKKLHTFLMSTWLDGINLPSDVKAKLREIFQSFASYRTFYNPGALASEDAPIDRTFLYSWSPASKETLELFEMCIFPGTSQLEYHMRSCARHGKDAAETLKSPPFSLKVEVITDQVTNALSSSMTGQPAEIADETPASDTKTVDPTIDVDSDEEGAVEANEEKGLIKEFVMRLVRNNMSLAVEPKSDAALTELYRASPLCTVQASPQSGNVAIILDANSYGEATSRPALRQVPMGKDVFKKIVGCLVKARLNISGDETPEKLRIGEIWAMFDAGVNRQRLFMANLKIANNAGKEKD